MSKLPQLSLPFYGKRVENHTTLLCFWKKEEKQKLFPARVYLSVFAGMLLSADSCRNKQKPEVTIMNCNANHCIRCTVNNCAYHCGGENYCTLETISVGTHEANPTECKCVDCESFMKK